MVLRFHMHAYAHLLAPVGNHQPSSWSLWFQNCPLRETCGLHLNHQQARPALPPMWTLLQPIIPPPFLPPWSLHSIPFFAYNLLAAPFDSFYEEHVTVTNQPTEAEFMNLQISLGFLAIILRILRLEVSVYNVYTTNQF
jgi:hypothetical protein